MYCVYLTVYIGNKLPPFYIGSTSIDKIEKGYRGSIDSRKYGDVFKQELKDNPHLFKVKIVEKFDDRKQALLREEWYQRKLRVVDSELYMNTGYATTGCFGISMPGSDNPFYDRRHSEERKKIIGEQSRARMNTERARSIRANRKVYFGHTVEAKQKMSARHREMNPVTCPHCQLQGKYAIMKRWHFDRCKKA